MPTRIKKRVGRPTRIQRIAKLLAERSRKHKETKGIRTRPLQRKEQPANPKRRGKIIAYDLETTRIKAGTPTPLYITAYGAEFFQSCRVKNIHHLLDILEALFLTPETINSRFVAWNGNNFDAYLIAAALLHEPRWIIKPYLTRGKSLRGFKVTDRDNDEHTWEFLDGMAMLGMTGVKLDKFLESFAPEYRKLDAPDWEHEEFNYKNKQHVEYAERDSEGLFHALMRAQEITQEHFDIGLKSTIGNMGIRIFIAHIPHDVKAYRPSLKVIKIVRDFVMRGGFCFCVNKYEGLIWKYDINQAYAAAMRETDLPSGRCTHLKGESKYARCSILRVSGSNKRNFVPFYHKTMDGKSVFSNTIVDSWITSNELSQLRREGWNIKVVESYNWDESFRMKHYVDKLEQLRTNAEGGPNSALGQVMKYIGNNSYGKTVEELDGLDLIMSNEQPEGYHEWDDEEATVSNIWFRLGDITDREYHQPQLGSFITSYVRMQVRRAILLNPNAWLYADTDCVIFKEPVKLNIDPKIYGLWKEEAAGENYRLITKKVYADFGAKTKHAKGINVKRLTNDDFINWYNGIPPVQTQIHRQNFLRVMTGFDMYVERVKTGQKTTQKTL